MTREQLFRFFFIVVFAFIIFQILLILSPFFTGILGAIVLHFIFYPLHRWVGRRLGGKSPNLLAALSTLSVVILIVLPVMFLAWMLVNELNRLLPLLEPLGQRMESWRRSGYMIESPGWIRIEEKLRGVFDLMQINFQIVFAETADGLSTFTAQLTRGALKKLLLLGVNLLVMVFTLFFIFRDGEMLFHRLKDLVPMDEKHKDQIASQLHLTVTAVVRGVFIVAVAQGFLAGIGYLIVRVPSPVVLSFATMACALVPLVGATIVWLPIAVYFLFTGATAKGVILLLWGALVVSMIDNFLRPILIGSRAKLPILLLFFGILGGFKIYGFLGIFLGPLVIALLLAFIRIYREEYQRKAAPNSPS